MPQLSLGRTCCAGQVRGNCMRRDSSGLEGAVGLQRWKGGNLWQPMGPLPMQRDPQELLSSTGLCHQNTTNIGASSAWSPTASWQDPVFPFLCVFFSPLLFILHDSFTLPISWTTEILPSGPFSRNETHIPAEALAPVHNRCSGSKEETRKKKRSEEEDCAVFLEERWRWRKLLFYTATRSICSYGEGRFCNQSSQKLERHFGRYAFQGAKLPYSLREYDPECLQYI